MAEENGERKPFITFSFTEEGVFDRYAGIYLHLPLEKPPTGEEIAIMVGTIKTYAKCWQALQGKLGLVEAQRDGLDEPLPGAGGPRVPQHPPPDEPQAPPAPKPASRPRSSSTTIRDPSVAASKSQIGMVRGICGRVDAKVVLAAFKKFGELDGAYDKDGHYIPSWDFLNRLNMGEAAEVIDALKTFE